MDVERRTNFPINFYDLNVFRLKLCHKDFRQLLEQFENSFKTHFPDRNLGFVAELIESTVKRIAEIAHQSINESPFTCSIKLQDILGPENLRGILKDGQINASFVDNKDVIEKFEKILNYVFTDLIPGQCANSFLNGRITLNWIKKDLFAPKISAIAKITFTPPTPHTLFQKDEFLLKTYTLPEYEGYVMRGEDDETKFVPFICQDQHSFESLMQKLILEPGVKRIEVPDFNIDIQQSTGAIGSPTTTEALNNVIPRLIEIYSHPFVMAFILNIKIPEIVNMLANQGGDLPESAKQSMINECQELCFQEFKGYLLDAFQNDLKKQFIEAKITQQELLEYKEVTFHNTGKIDMCLSYAMPIGKILSVFTQESHIRQIRSKFSEIFLKHKNS